MHKPGSFRSWHIALQMDRPGCGCDGRAQRRRRVGADLSDAADPSAGGLLPGRPRRRDGAPDRPAHDPIAGTPDRCRWKTGQGAGGTIAARTVAEAEPDGYTLLLGNTSTLIISPLMFKNVGYDALKATFTPIARLGTTSRSSWMHQSGLSGQDAWRSSLHYAKANPGKLNYSTPGIENTAASDRRDAQAPGRGGDRARPLQERRPVDPGRDRRRGAIHFRESRHCAAAGAGRGGARAGGDQRGARSAGARRPDLGRRRPARIRLGLASRAWFLDRPASRAIS